MLQSRFLLPALLFGLVLPAYFALAVEVPPLDALRKPVEETQEVINDDEPILPSAVSPERLVTDLARLCPEDPVWFITVPDAARLSADWHASTLGQFTNEAAMEKTLRDNRFGLQFLFSDLPSSVIAPVRITAVASVMELANSLARQSQKMAMAAYVDDDGNLDFLFLLDVGSDRVPAFSTIGEWVPYFFLANPGSDVLRGNHA
ncbi:MAG: hypothetical protein LIP77_09520, partial [Planctomycetes bacterium]|nr:hypothetical protein [Planctomycetota bacterium]